ncbi:NADH-quinone oxidoreductase subunit L [Natronospira proteinivora]|uniref:NADH-quinone oxidoreductase subunit L n=1 Tax=Natronospira proteinivora TaxID=1807133 RepID=A0ABT1G6P6_9GAMM|nr:NADH-quinone oxidoreductase subunit L [Natronospira proteinivora]MCP1726973.1 NADH-quinone oxidoreductase subunit L [Natronospira proteinivora]
MENVYLTIVLAPLVAAIIAGFFGHKVGRAGAHWATIIAVGIAFLLSLWVFWQQWVGDAAVFNGSVYTWMVSEGVRFEVGFLIDRLSAMMMVVVTFVSLMVHIYTIGYMKDDPGYQRFFAYISLFTFAMLMLVMSNNFLQLFFGWEAVGLVSYLLIGFWHKRPSAIHANLKAFLVNRVGDFGFLLGIAAIFLYFNSMDYMEVFGAAPDVSGETMSIFGGLEWSVLTVICILLFIGAMGKSAQVPLHVWLPDSMEGPTPISALIHAATMVTAGIYMVARMSPLFELSVTALSVVITIGAITALFMGLLGLVQHDIKRVVAYSTLSQLGYMTVALGASAYAASIFHLMTHAFFKALLFLAAGSVIIGMHHIQDMRQMGGLRKYMPITYVTCLVGALALIGFPGFSGFFSKDGIIEAVALSEIPGAGFAYWAVLIGVFVTALYTFRMFFLVFHGKERMDEHTKHDLKESPWVVTAPLILLAIPSVIIGAPFVSSMLLGDFFTNSIHVAPERDVLGMLGEKYDGAMALLSHGLVAAPVYLALAGVVVAWFLYLKRPDLPGKLATALGPVHRLLENKYYFDAFNEKVIAPASRGLGRLFWQVGDVRLIDGLIVNGSARLVGWIAGAARRAQTGFLYHYAFAMVIGLAALLAWLILR